MKLPTFLGGTDEQRSNNLAENKLINLYPTTNNDGSVAGFYKVDGLKSEGTLSGVPTGAYKASNGRSFYTSGTVLYELTVVGGVYTSTNSGTITSAINYEFSDNGLEMIMVNGTDGWIFTFSDNSIDRLLTITGDFTVQEATYADVDATITKTSHGLNIGDRITFSTTGSLPSNLLPSTPYYVLADSFTTNSFKVGLTATGAVCTISNATPAVISSANHGFYQGSKVRFLTTGALPSPLVAGTVYYVISDGFTSNQFRISATLNGTAINTTTAGSGVHTFNPAITIIQTGTETVYTSIATGASVTCTINNASPAVVTKVTHGLIAGNIVKFKTTGEIPIGIAQGKIYFVKTVLTADTFTVTESLDGTAVNTSSAGSGVHSLIIIPSGVCTTQNPHTFEIKDVIRFSTTGALPTGISAGIDYYVTGYSNVEFFNGPAIDKTSGLNPWVYIPNPYNQPKGSSPLLVKGVGTLNSMLFMDEGAAVKFYSDGALPPSLIIGTTYYLVKTNIVDIFGISKSVGGAAIYLNVALGNGTHTIIDTSNFSVSTTEAGVYGTRVNFTGSQSGSHAIFDESSKAFGTHTFFTSSYGFPEGCKLISYMNGRFIAAEPSTQNFYVSEVLDGKTWDAINVQTVDSNPDYVTGHAVSHNELVMFCENSGEIYYDSGTTPTPFVRNQTGIFEVGCLAPYTIKVMDNSVFWLGNTLAGNGIIYKLAGLTPQRISTYSIEYQIQQMTDVSDAYAFTYQKDGHHFYVLTFPTGNKTFVFDANTNLWHERLSYIYTLVNGEYNYVINIGDKVDYATSSSPYATAYDSLTKSVWVTHSALAKVSKINVFTGAITQYNTNPAPYAATFDNITNSIWIVNNGDSTVSKVNVLTGEKVQYAVGLSPQGIAFDSTTSSVWVTNNAANTVSKVNISTGTKVDYATGSGPLGIAFDGITGSVWIVNYNANTVSKVNILTGTKVDYATGTNPVDVVFDSITSSVWTTNWGANTVSKINILTGTKVDYAAGSFPYCATFDPTSGSIWVTNRITPAGTISKINILTGSKSEYPVGSFPIHISYENATNSVWVANSASSNVSKVSTISGSYLTNKWPANKYLYFNNEHLIVDATATLYSIDSATYKNGNDPIRIVRSFRAPPSDMKRVAHHAIQVDCEVGIGTGTEPVIALRWSDDAGNTWSTPIEKGLGIAGEYSKSVIFRRLGATKGLPRIYELSCDENVKITLLDCYLE